MNKKLRWSFTIVEFLVVIGIITILLSFGSVNLFRARNLASLNATLDLLIADIKNQQVNTMSSDNINLSANIPYGVYFENNKYVLFHSSSYLSTDSNNFNVSLGDGVIFFQINLPDSRIIFASQSGEIQNYNPSQNTIIIKNTNSNDQKTVTINRYGVVTNVN